MCYHLAGGTLRGRPTPRFRTFQVCPKDLRALPVHPEPAVSWHSGLRGGAMLDLRRREFITLLGSAPTGQLARTLCPGISAKTSLRST